MRAAFNSQTQDKEIYLKFVGDHDLSKVVTFVTFVPGKIFLFDAGQGTQKNGLIKKGGIRPHLAFLGLYFRVMD